MTSSSCRSCDAPPCRYRAPELEIATEAPVRRAVGGGCVPFLPGSLFRRDYEMAGHLRIAVLPYSVPIDSESKGRALAFKTAGDRRYPKMGFSGSRLRKIIR